MVLPINKELRMTGIEPGDLVVDREQAPEERHEAVVVNVREETVSEVEVEERGGHSVAQLNPRYGPGETAVDVAFLEDVEDWIAAEYEATEEAPQVSVETLSEAAESDDLDTYTYPEARLLERSRS